MSVGEEYQEKVSGRLYTIVPESEERASQVRTFIDSHIHLFRQSLYSWLNETKPVTFEGDWTPIEADYTPEDLLAEAEGTRVQIKGAVHVQANAMDPVAETAEVQRMADEAGLPVSIVGGGDLSSPDFEDVVERQLAYPGFHAVRQILNIHPHPLYAYVDTDFMNDPKWLAGLRVLAKHGLAFDMQLYPTQFKRALQVIDSNPDVTFIINHAGMLADRSLDGWRLWSEGLYELGQRDNVAMKVSGLASMDHYWTIESIKPAIFTCLDAFGTDKCMFASNFPVDKLHGSYVDTVLGFVRATEELSQSERDALFVDNARRYYKF